MSKTETFTLKEQIEHARRALARSHSTLFVSVNMHVVNVLEKGLKNKRSRKQIAENLTKAIGPKKRNEPSSFCNLRGAASSVLDGGRLSLL